MLGVGLTLLKRLCRQSFGIERWPHRKRSCLQQLVEHLKSAPGDALVGLQRRHMRPWRADVVPKQRWGSDTDVSRDVCFKSMAQAPCTAPQLHAKPTSLQEGEQLSKQEVLDELR